MPLDLPTLLGLISSAIRLLKLLEEMAEKRKLKSILWRIIEDDVEKAKTAIDRLSDDVALAFGASLFYGMFFEPFDPDSKAKQLIENISTDYRELLESLSSLSKIILTYQDEFKEFFSPTEWVYIEGVLSAVKENKFDTKTFSKLIKTWSTFQQTENQLLFQEKFLEYLTEFNKQTGIDELNRQIGLNDKEYQEFMINFLERCLTEFLGEAKHFKLRQRNKRLRDS